MMDAPDLSQKDVASLIEHIVAEDLNLDYHDRENAESLRTKIAALYNLRKKADRNGLSYALFDSPADLAADLERERERVARMAQGLGIEVLSRDTIEGVNEKIALALARHYAGELELVWDPEEDADTIMDRIEAFKNEIAAAYPSLADWLPATFSLSEINARIAILAT